MISRHLDSRDRPGNPPSSIAPGSTDADGRAFSSSAEWELPGTLRLPLPGAPDWQTRVEGKIVAHLDRWGIDRLPIDHSLGLDLAVQGLPPRGKDLDNLAHVVIKSFQSHAALDDASLVSNYRVYRRHGTRAGIRIRLHVNRLQLKRD